MSKTRTGLLGALMGIAILATGEAYGQTHVPLPQAVEPEHLMFHKEAGFTESADYDVVATAIFKATLGPLESATASYSANGTTLFSNQAIVGGWLEENGTAWLVDGYSIDLTSSMTVSGGPFQEAFSKTLTLPGLITSGQELLPGDSTSYVTNALSAHVLESVIFQAFSSRLRTVDFYFENGTGWTLIDSTDFNGGDNDFDFGLAGLDHQVDRQSNSQYVRSIGESSWGIRMKVVASFADDSTNDLYRDIPLLQELAAGGGGGAGDGPGN